MRNIALSALVILTFLLSSTSVKAQSVDILWEGITYTPPFYQGRPLWSKQSEIRFVAIPQGLGDPASLNYRWLRGSVVLGNISGVGRNTLTIIDSIFSKPQNISVEIVGYEDAILASSRVDLLPIPQSVSVYENNPLYGFMLHQEIEDTYIIGEDEVSFVAFPLYFSAVMRGVGHINYNWSANGAVGESDSMVTYRAPEGQSGRSLISLSIRNTFYDIQLSSKRFLVEFGQ